MKKIGSKKNVIICILLFIMLVETMILFFHIYKREEWVNVSHNIDVVDLRYNDSFNVIDVYDAEGQTAILEYGEKNTILFYLSSSCTSCGNVLRFVERLNSVLGQENLKILLLWSDTIPVSFVEECGISLDVCYSTGKKIALNAPTPTAYLLDGQGNVIYYNSDIKIAIEKLYKQIIEDGINQEDIRHNANEYLMNMYGISNFDKQQIIYFCMEGCPDCELADEVLRADLEKDKRNLYYLYTYNDVEPSHLKDEYALLSLVYEIEWYPSFLVFQSAEDYRIVGEVPVENLVKELDSSIY